MAGLEALAALAGDWTATYQHRGDPSFECDTPSTATVAPILGGRFVRIDYTWDADDVLEEQGPQEGSLLVGFVADPEPGVATVAWVDSWHSGSKLQVSPGIRLANGGVDVRGVYSAPGDPEWGWRTILEPADEGRGWTMTMFNITPDGEESLAVRAEYARATD
jgi:hypothetical protein